MKIIHLILFILFILFFITCKKNHDISTEGSTAVNPLPAAVSMSPNAAAAGSATFTITLTGTNFTNTTTINWNGGALVTTYLSTTQISAIVPAANITTVGTASVTAVSPTPGGGTSAVLTFTISSGVVNNPSPSATAISPLTITAGSAAFTLTATGTNFINGSSINWNGTALATTFVNNTQLTAQVAAANIVTTGTVPITVFTPLPGGGTSSAQTFTVAAANNPIPAITTLAPNNTTAGSAAFTLTVTGSSFVNGSVIKWNGTALTTAYVTATQLTATIPALTITAAGVYPVTVFSPTPGGGTSTALSFTVNSGGTTGAVKKFLFDASHAETAGNADWVIDEDNSTPQRIPTPAQSTVTVSTNESYWTGAISSWGIALAKKGHTVETLSNGTAITYGNAANVQDLSNYNVFVVDEPNKVFSAAEKVAILSFVNAGGGLFMVSDHTGSDRDNDGWDSPAIWNDLMSNNTIQNNPFGFTIDLANFSDITSNVSSTATSNIILSGSEGTVTQLQFNNGTTATLTPASNATVKGLIWQTATSQNTMNVMSLSSTYGSGRMFFVGDSSPIDDGTGAPGNNLSSNWSNYSHANLFMNASLWLAKVQ